MFFIDRLDGPVFLETGIDILKNKSGIYYEGSLQYKFNYFPLAFLAILPGQILYYLLQINNSFLQRLFLKLPFLIFDILLPLIIRKNNQIPRNSISNIELFILFNPFIIYTSAVKGQFDIIPVFFFYLSWIKYKQNKITQSGFYAGISILFKQYGVIYSFYLFFHILKSNKKNGAMFVLGHVLITIPVLIIGFLLNFKGMLEHAILFHLKREPFGFSLTNMFQKSFLFVNKQTDSIVFTQLADFIILFFSLILISLILIFVARQWKHNYSNSEFLHYLLIVYLFFYLLNKGFLIQYLIIYVVIFALLTMEIESSKVIDLQYLGWNAVLLPLFIVIKPEEMTPVDVQILLGSNWFILLLFSGIVGSISTLIFLEKHEYKLISIKNSILYYLLLLVAIIIRSVVVYYVEIV